MKKLITILLMFPFLCFPQHHTAAGILASQIQGYILTFDVENSVGTNLTGAVITFDGTTYGAGVYTMPDLVENGTYNYSISKTGYATTASTVTVSGADKTKTVVLHGYTVTFTVNTTNAIITYNGVTNSANNYVFTEIPNGTYAYTVTKTGYNPASGNSTVSGANKGETTNLVAHYTLGQSVLGGQVGYILQSGDPGYSSTVQHGLIVYTAATVNGYYGCSGWVSGATGTAIGTGLSNTNILAANCARSSLGAQNCLDLVSGAYSDWYMASKDELYKCFLNRSYFGGMTSYYISSSEYNKDQMWQVNASGSGTPYSTFKYYYNHVLPISSF